MLLFWLCLLVEISQVTEHHIQVVATPVVEGGNRVRVEFLQSSLGGNRCRDKRYELGVGQRYPG